MSNARVPFRKVLATALAAAAAACVWYLGYWALGLAEWDSPDFLLFLGRLHPAVLHLPIGLLFLAVLMDLSRLTPWGGQLPRTTGLMGLVTLTAFFAAVHGILLFAGEDYGGSELARRHLLGGSLFTTLAAAVFVLKLWANDGRLARRIGGVSLVATFVVMTFASHDGASITHGSGYLAKYAPGPLKTLLGGKVTAAIDNETPLEQREVYEVAVQPILDLSCVKCHNPEKSKGRLRMDSYAGFAEGGKSGPAFVANSVKDSLFLQRIYLPLTDEEHMPPEDHPQPAAEQVAVLEWWIQSGAPETGTLASFNPSDSVMRAIRTANQTKTTQQEVVDVPKIDLESLGAEVDTFNGKLTGRLTFVLAGEAVLHFDCFDGPDLVNDEVLEQLIPFAPYLQNIDLNNSAVTTAGVARLLAYTEGLERLSLNGCAVDDGLVDAALDCSSLRSISLMGTGITNEGLSRLIQHPAIKNIYVGNSAVTPEGKQQALEQLSLPKIILGPGE